VDRQRLGLAEGRLAQINHIRERVVKESLALFTLALRVSQFERRAVDTYNTKFFSPPTRLAGGRMRTSNQTKNGNGALKES
jgi:hypothetical protein